MSVESQVTRYIDGLQAIARIHWHVPPRISIPVKELYPIVVDDETPTNRDRSTLLWSHS
jgi:hypothetical protein